MIQKSSRLSEIQRQLDLLLPEEQLVLIEHLTHTLRKVRIPETQAKWDELYGLGKGIWQEDAQEYVNRIREDRG